MKLNEIACRIACICIGVATSTAALSQESLGRRPEMHYGTATTGSALSVCLDSADLALNAAGYTIYKKTGNVRLAGNNEVMVQVVCYPLRSGSTSVTFTAFSSDSKTAELARNSIRSAVLDNENISPAAAGPGTCPQWHIGVTTKSAPLSACVQAARAELAKAGYQVAKTGANPVLGISPSAIVEIACTPIGDRTILTFTAFSSDSRAAELARNSMRTAVLTVIDGRVPAPLPSTNPAGSPAPEPAPAPDPPAKPTGSPAPAPAPAPPASGPVVTAVRITPAVVTNGQRARLAWLATNYKKVEISPAIHVSSGDSRVPDDPTPRTDITEYAGSGLFFYHRPHYPDKTTTYTLTFTGPNGVAVRKVTVTNRFIRFD